MRKREFLFVLLICELILLNTVCTIINIAARVGYPLYVIPVNVEYLVNASYFLTYILFISDLGFLKTGIANIFKFQTKKFFVFTSLFSFSTVVFYEPAFSSKSFLFLLSAFLILQVVFVIVCYFFFKVKNQKDLTHAVIIGDNQLGRQMFRYISTNTFLGMKPLGFISVDGNKMGSNTIGRITDFQKLHDRMNFEDVFITVPLSDGNFIRSAIEVCEMNGIKLHIFPNYYGNIKYDLKVGNMGNIPLLNLRSIPLEKYVNRFWKRAFDILVSFILIILALPLLFIIAIAIWLEDRGPVFYSPVRYGAHGSPFRLYKFRSMRISKTNATDTRSTIKNDPRVTKVGRFLRRNNLDELPQLFNVLQNDMSLIGPRPHRLKLNTHLQQKVNGYMIRHLVKPGITGWAQVNGWRGPTEMRIQYMGRILHDLWYIEHWTFALDIYILFLTLFGTKTMKNAF